MQPEPLSPLAADSHPAAGAAAHPGSTATRPAETAAHRVPLTQARSTSETTARSAAGETGSLGLAPVAERVGRLNARHAGLDAPGLLARAMGDAELGRIAMVSSFGAESVVLLHMAARVDPTLPVLFVDTEMLFPETLAYQDEVARALGLTNVVRVTADPAAIAFDDPDGTLHQFSTDACCDLRKTRPLEAALDGFDAWITGRKRFQATTRAALDFFEAEGDRRVKINPLALWGPGEVAAYMAAHDLPRHPLVARGYPSIGCAPCTSPVAPGEDPRAGRWRGEAKVECGIHFIDGKLVRPEQAGGQGGIPANGQTRVQNPGEAGGGARNETGSFHPGRKETAA